MVKPTILRVVDGMVLSPEVEASLKQLLNDYTIERYSSTPDNKKSTQARIDSIHKSFLFMLESLPLRPQFTRLNAATLRAYANECKAATDLKDSDSMQQLQTKLTDFTKKMVEAIAISWEWEDPVKDALEALDDAEQYLLMAKGRNHLATLTSTKRGNETEYILQLDKTVPSYTQEWLDELTKIKELGFPKTRIWFRDLPDYQKDYFCNWDTGRCDPEDILQDLNTFISFWQKAKKDSLNINSDLKRFQTDSQPIPERFKELNPRHKQLLINLTEMNSNIDAIDTELAKFKTMITDQAKDLPTFKLNLNNLNKIPEWYWVLAKHEQFFLQFVLNSTQKIEEVVSALSSRHRSLPALANLGTTSLHKISENGEKTMLASERWRFAHIVSRDALDFPKSVRLRHAKSNLQFIKNQAKPQQPLFVGTLISPIIAADKVPTSIKKALPLPPDLELWNLLETLIDGESNPNLFSTNHPQNIVKYYYYTEADNPKSKKLITEAERRASYSPELKELLNDYKNVLNSGPGTATCFDRTNRELFLSSYEQLIILKMDGLASGSCVSGKDRKAMEILHTHAMLIYKDRYGTWPKFNDSADKRANFVQIFTELYVSWHQHVHAGQNAPGADGIKTPRIYLPADIISGIERLVGSNALTNDDRRASNNDIDKISKELKILIITPYALEANLMAKQLGADNCNKLYDALTPAIGESSQFIRTPNFFPAAMPSAAILGTAIPTGIFEIQKIASDPKNGKSNVYKMGLIFKEILMRPENEDRSDATRSIYGKNKSFFNIVDGKKTVINKTDNQLVEEAVKEWRNLLSTSKAHKAAAKRKSVKDEPPQTLASSGMS